MNNEEYKQITSLWTVKRRNTIDDSLRLIMGKNSELAEKLKSTLASTPVQKPEKHAGGKETDYFEVLLNEEETQKLIDLLFELDGVAANESTQTGEACRIAALVNVWNKLNLVKGLKLRAATSHQVLTRRSSSPAHANRRDQTQL